jgi:hypothetical protein
MSWSDAVFHSCSASDGDAWMIGARHKSVYPKPIRKRAVDQRAVVIEADRYGEQGYSQEG